MTAKKQVETIFNDSIRAVETARPAVSAQVADAAAALAETLEKGNKILVCGNGGSAADSLHFSSELLNKYHRVRRPLAAISLVADTPTISSISNDESYDAVFSRQVEALGRQGDILVAITTSGNSPSILRAVHAAQTLGMRCIALNGKGGGALSSRMGEKDIDIVVPGDQTARAQEVHGIIIHVFCELIDNHLFGENT